MIEVCAQEKNVKSTFISHINENTKSYFEKKKLKMKVNKKHDNKVN